jgi:hypothetical protein
MAVENEARGREPKYRPEELLNSVVINPSHAIESMFICRELSIKEACEYCEFYFVNQSDSLFILEDERAAFGGLSNLSFVPQKDEVFRLWGKLEGMREASVAGTESLQGIPESIPLLPSSNGSCVKEPEIENSISPIRWKWRKAELAWLWDTLVAHNAIECSASAFSKLFLQTDGKRMPLGLADFIRSANPQKPEIREFIGEIGQYANTRNKTPDSAI